MLRRRDGERSIGGGVQAGKTDEHTAALLTGPQPRNRAAVLCVLSSEPSPGD